MFNDRTVREMKDLHDTPFCCYRHQKGMGRSSKQPKTHCQTHTKLGIINDPTHKARPKPQPLQVVGIAVQGNKLNTEPLVTNVAYKYNDRRSIPSRLRTPFVYVKTVHDKGRNQLAYHPSNWLDVIKIQSRRLVVHQESELQLSMTQSQRDHQLLKASGLPSVIFKLFKNINECFKSQLYDKSLAQSHDKPTIKEALDAFIAKKGITRSARTKHLIFTKAQFAEFMAFLGIQFQQQNQNNLTSEFWNYVYDQSIVDGFKISQKYLQEKALSRTDVGNALKVISMRAFIYNFNKYYTQKKGFFDIFSKEASKRRNLHLRQLLAPGAKQYRMLQYNLNLFKPIQQAMLTKFKQHPNFCQLQQWINNRNKYLFQYRTICKYIWPIIQKYMLNFRYLVQGYQAKLQQGVEKTQTFCKFLQAIKQNYHLPQGQERVVSAEQLADMVVQFEYEPTARRKVIGLIKKFYYFLKYIKGEQNIIFDGKSENPKITSDIKFTTGDLKEFLHLYRCKKSDQLEVLRTLLQQVYVFYEQHVLDKLEGKAAWIFECNLISEFILRKVLKLTKNLRLYWHKTTEMGKAFAHYSQRPDQFWNQFERERKCHDLASFKALLSSDHPQQLKIQYFGYTKQTWDSKSRGLIERYKSNLNYMEHVLGPVALPKQAPPIQNPVPIKALPEKKRQLDLPKPRSVRVEQARPIQQKVKTPNSHSQLRQLPKTYLEGEICEPEIRQKNCNVYYDCDGCSNISTEIDYLQQQATLMLEEIMRVRKK